MSIGVAEITALVKNSPQVTVADFSPGARLHAALRPLTPVEAAEDRGNLATLEMLLEKATLTDRQRNRIRNSIVAIKLRLKNVETAEESPEEELGHLYDTEANNLLRKGAQLCDAMESPHISFQRRVELLAKAREVIATLASRGVPPVKERDKAEGTAAMRKLARPRADAKKAFKDGCWAAAQAMLDIEPPKPRKKRKLATV